MVKWFVWAAAIASFALMAGMFWPEGEMISRDIGCARGDSARGREICNALSESMEWTWLGHAIISPGWRLRRDAARDVYCREKIGEADLPVLEGLKRGRPDWRLESGADQLIRIVRNRDGKGDEPENSIFNPKHPQYILKNGCAR